MGTGAALAWMLSACSGSSDASIVSPLEAVSSSRAQRIAADTSTQLFVLADGATARIERTATSQEVDGVAMLTTTPGIEPYACDPSGVWAFDWRDAFLGVTTYREAGYTHQYLGVITIYPGAHIADGSNTNSLTYIGACNGDVYVDLQVTIDRRVNGNWSPILTVTVHGGERFIFQSGIPAQYRGRTEGANGMRVEHLGVAAAWNISRLVTRGR